MGRRPAPPDEMHESLMAAKEAVDRVKWTGEDRLWFKKMDEMGYKHKRPFVEPIGGARKRSSLKPNRDERKLIVKAWRRALPLEKDGALQAAEGTGPLSLTLAAWTSIRADLIRLFYKPRTKKKERQMERLIATIEGLVTSALQPDYREKASPPSGTATARNTSVTRP